MGSYAISQSSTNYTNTPLTLGNGDNPIGVAGSTGTQLGGSSNVNGSSNLGNTTLTQGSSLVSNSLDGGAISQAFNFAANTFGVLQDVIKNNQDAHDHISGTTTEAITAQNQAAQAAAPANNYTQYVKWVGLGVIGYFAWKAFK